MLLNETHNIELRTDPLGRFEVFNINQEQAILLETFAMTRAEGLIKK